MFTRAIVKRPSPSMIHGITQAGLGQPDYTLALKQHDAYIHALQTCGLEVTVLPAEDAFPDAVFIEDTALLTPNGAFITHPGAPERRGETISTRQAVSAFYPPKQMVDLQPPGTLDAGDVMMVGTHFFIGLSERTNPAGAQTLIQTLEGWGLTGSTVDMPGILHLKTGVVYLEHKHLLMVEAFADAPCFSGYQRHIVPQEEAYAGNSVWVNDRVLVPDGYPQVRRIIEAMGYETLPLDMSEFRKLDGGLSCLSLRF